MTKSRTDPAASKSTDVSSGGKDRRRRLVAWLDSLSGWHRRGLLMGLGLLAMLAMPPLHFWPLLFIALPGLILLTDRSRGVAAAFWTGWWFGLGHFIPGFYWIANSMLTDPWRFGWMIPFAVGGLAAFMAVYIGLAAGLARLLWTPGPARILALGGAWIVGEWLRSWVLTGFPWNLLGYSWAFSDQMMQVAAWTGSWGLSLITVIACGLPALLFRWSPASENPPPLAGGPGAAAIAGLVILGIVWSIGAVRLSGASDAFVPGITLRLVQPSIPPEIKNSADRRVENLNRLLSLSLNSPGRDKITHVIWPESAVPYLLERNADVRRALARVVPPEGLLITGAVRAEPDTGDLERIWNSALAVDGNAAIVARFDKFHLVPYGEYVPQRELFPFIAKITPGSMDFSAGPGPRTLHLPGLPPVGPLICYELIFPGDVADRDDHPQWLLSLTNDAWFGRSTGPYQHFASARFRAVEEGVPMVRAANAGVSGVIDAYGRVQALLDLDAVGVIDHGLPARVPSATLFARLGNWLLLLLVAVTAVLIAVVRRVLA
jgi:apolipoprotein N-acyltransferase